MIDSQEFRDLCVAIDRYYGHDPHLGCANDDTIRALGFALDQAIRVSKARPAKYANEPWRTITAIEHLEHATVHLDYAHDGAKHGDNWLDDDGLPNAAHGILRAAFGLYLHEKGKL